MGFTKSSLWVQAEVDLRAMQAQAKGQPGKDWMLDTWVLTNDKYPNSGVRIKFTYRVSLFGGWLLVLVG